MNGLTTKFFMEHIHKTYLSKIKEKLMIKIKTCFINRPHRYRLYSFVPFCMSVKVNNFTLDAA